MNDRFQIISTLASNSNSTLQQAWDKLKNRDVAIKRLNVQGAQTEPLLYEARALYALRHPGIVTIHEYGADEQGAFLITEFIKGETLDHRLARGPLPLADFKALVVQTLEALDAAHTAGLIHRDLKPENIMLPWNSEGRFQVKLIDFGLSQAVPPEGAAQASMEGSVHFMAPEQFGSGHVDARTDLYAFGCVCYQALTGQLPFPGDEKTQVITAHLYPPRAPLAELRPDLSDGFCQWMDQLMSVQPLGRPASAAQALSYFHRLANHLQVKAAGVIEPEPAAVMILEEEEMPAAVVEEEPEEEASTLTPAEDEAPFLSPSITQPLEDVPAATASSTQPLVADAAATTQPLEEETFLRPSQTQLLEGEEEPLLATASTTQPIPAASAPQSEDPPTQRRNPQIQAPAQPAASSRKSRKAGLSMGLILTAFVVVILGQLGLASYFKFAGREDRQHRFEELSNDAEAHGSDLDVRVLLEFLENPATQDKAVKTLARLRGGAYIDAQLRDYLDRAKGTSFGLKVVQILGQRRDTLAFDIVAPLTTDARGEVRKAAWNTLARITTAANLPKAVALIRNGNGRDREDIEKALVSAVESAADRPAATGELLKAYRGAADHAESRATLFNILARVGGEGTLDLVKEAIADPSEKLRMAAIVVLADYPSHEPLAAITARFPEEKEDSCRTYLLLAARELVSKPGPSSQQALFLHAQSLYNHCKDTEEKLHALNVISRTISPSTADFFEDFAKNSDLDLRGEARDLAITFRNKLTQVVPVPAAEKATVPAAKADLRADGTLTLENGTLTQWTNEDDWASWLVELPSNGQYEVAIYQAHASSQTGTYEVLMAGQTVLTAVVQTASDKDFKGFVVGNFDVQQPGIYRLRIRPKTIPAEDSLLQLQKLVIKRL